MTASGPDVAARQTRPSLPGEPAPSVGAILASPVTVGPVAASSLGGIPFIAINGPTHHYSGKRLAQFVLGALEQLNCTIDVPD